MLDISNFHDTDIYWHRYPCLTVTLCYSGWSVVCKGLNDATICCLFRSIAMFRRDAVSAALAGKLCYDERTIGRRHSRVAGTIDDERQQLAQRAVMSLAVPRSRLAVSYMYTTDVGRQRSVPRRRHRTTRCALQSRWCTVEVCIHSGRISRLTDPDPPPLEHWRSRGGGKRESPEEAHICRLQSVLAFKVKGQGQTQRSRSTLCPLYLAYKNKYGTSPCKLDHNLTSSLQELYRHYSIAVAGRTPNTSLNCENIASTHSNVKKC